MDRLDDLPPLERVLIWALVGLVFVVSAAWFWLVLTIQ